MSSSLGTRIATINASAEMGEASQTASIKSFLAKWPGIRLQYRGKERRGGEMAHVFFLYVPQKTEARYAELFTLIGDKYYQGNKFAIYKWEQRSPAPTPMDTPAQIAQQRNALGKIGYNVTSTWGVPAFDDSVQVLRFERAKKE